MPATFLPRLYWLGLLFSFLCLLFSFLCLLFSFLCLLISPAVRAQSPTTLNGTGSGITYTGWLSSASRGLSDFQDDVHATLQKTVSCNTATRKVQKASGTYLISRAESLLLGD